MTPLPARLAAERVWHNLLDSAATMDDPEYVRGAATILALLMGRPASLHVGTLDRRLTGSALEPARRELSELGISIRYAPAAGAPDRVNVVLTTIPLAGPAFRPTRWGRP